MSYNKKIWKNGDIITKEGMNNIEDGIYNAHKEINTLKNNTSTASGVSIQDTANNFTSTNVEGALAELFQNVSNGKSLIASAITDKGVTTSNTDTFQTMATNIGQISTSGSSTQYTVTYNLSNVTSSNTATTVNNGSTYTTTLTANSGYELDVPTITVDGIDVTNKYYSDGVFTLNNVFGNIIITATATQVIIADGITLNYSFNNDTPGNGYGTISLLVDNEKDAGDYVIKYADDSGEMTNYDNICTLGVNAGTQTNYAYFNEHQLIPKYATKLIAVKNDEVKAEFVIPTAKRFTSGNYGEHLYSFGAISDIHTGVTTWDTDLQAALTYLKNNENVIFTCVSGDITDNGTANEFTTVKGILDNYTADTPFYATNGNHEFRNSSFSDEFWNTYMNNPMDYVFTQDNDVFIMLGIHSSSGDSSCFTNEQKTWLETLLAKYVNCRVFLFSHSYLNGTDNGDANNYYNGPILSVSSTNGKWLLELLKQYTNVFYFSGHSHLKFIVQELCSKINVCNEYNSKKIGYLLHLPSITNPRDVINGTVTGKLTSQSEGVVIDVYENCVLYRGRNFVNEKFIPIGQFLLPKAQGTLPSEVYCTGVTLDQTTLALDSTTNSATLTATVTPEGCTDELLWSSNAIEIATVDNGIVTAVSDGVAIITATCGSYSAECNVTVTNMIADDGTINITYNDGVKIDRNTGAESSSSSSYASTYIAYDSSKQYTVSVSESTRDTGNYIYVCYYNSDKTFLSCTSDYVGYASSGYFASSVLSPPESTGYMRLRGSFSSGDYATSQAQITLTATAQ